MFVTPKSKGLRMRLPVKSYTERAQSSEGSEKASYRRCTIVRTAT